MESQNKSQQIRGEGRSVPEKIMPKEMLEFWTWERVKALLLKRYELAEENLKKEYYEAKKEGNVI